MTYAWDNDSTQNAHIKQMRDDRQNSIVVDVMCAMFKNLNIKQGDSNETLQAN